jgi:hypothetical protein
MNPSLLVLNRDWNYWLQMGLFFEELAKNVDISFYKWLESGYVNRGQELIPPGSRLSSKLRLAVSK